jgi:adenylylsulfate kinase-like enzyme
MSRPLRAPAVLLTGHPSAGKTTLSRALSALLVQRGVPSEVLDGDELRRRLPPALGFGLQDRSHQFTRALYVAELLSAHGVVPILALIAPLARDRDGGRERFAEVGWHEIHLDVPRAVLVERDTRGVYARLESQGGPELVQREIFEVYEPPVRPSLRLDTSRMTVAEAALAVAALLDETLAA